MAETALPLPVMKLLAAGVEITAEAGRLHVKRSAPAAFMAAGGKRNRCADDVVAAGLEQEAAVGHVVAGEQFGRPAGRDKVTGASMLPGRAAAAGERQQGAAP